MILHRQLRRLIPLVQLKSQAQYVPLQLITTQLKTQFSGQKQVFNITRQDQQSEQKQSQKKSLPTFSQLQCKSLISQPNPLRDIILQQINQYGQMKLQKYWKLALTDSQYGYYRQENVFSKQGDFTTSPEISPLFGEMIAVWISYFLNKIGVIDQNTQTVTKKFRLVEFGPGRGLLMRDIVKSLHQMKITHRFDISFVQVSQYNRKCQQQNLFEQFKKYDEFFRFEFENTNKDVQIFRNQNQFRQIDVKWYQNLQMLIKQDYDLIQSGKSLPVTVFFMNQFFDALSTSIFEFTQNGWRQKIIAKTNNPQMPLCLKNSTHQLPQKMKPTIKNPTIGQKIQVSHDSLMTIDAMAKLLLISKGAILNIDYGAQKTFTNSIRAIKQHKFIPEPYFWQIPGKCDLSAYVNFAALADFATNSPQIHAFEAVPQGFFLQAMGINPRIQILQKRMNKQQKEKLQSEYDRLVHPEQMGQNFKVQCITLKEYGELYPWIQDKQGVY